MVFGTKCYSALVVSSSDKFNDFIRPMLSDRGLSPAYFVTSVAAAKREMAQKKYDVIIINSPLPDDLGLKFAIDSSQGKSSVCLVLFALEQYEDNYVRASENGVFTLPKPVSSSMLSQALVWLGAARERLNLREGGNLSIEEKMEEIRLVNRAKWILIEKNGYSEDDAHRYITREAMDGCISKKEVAERIINTIGG